MRWLFLLLLLPLTSCREKDPWSGNPSVPAQISFNQHIRPVLSRECLECHRQENAQGGLRLDLASGISSVTTDNSPKKSLLWEKIAANHPIVLPELEKAIFWRWIKQGTTSEGHWASLPLKKSAPTYSLSPTEPVTEEEFAFLTRTLFGRAPNTNELDYLAQNQPPRADLIDSMNRQEEFTTYFKTRFLLLTGTEPVSPQGPFAPYLRWLDTELSNPSFALDDFIRKSLAGDLIPNGGQESTLASAWTRLPNQAGDSSLAQRVSRNFLALAPDRAESSNDLWPDSEKTLPLFLPVFPPADRGGIATPPFLPLHTPQQIEALRQAKEAEAAAWARTREVPDSATVQFSEWLAQEKTSVSIPDLAVAFSFDDANPSDQGALPLATLTQPFALADGVQGTALSPPANFTGMPLASDHPFTLSFFLKLSHLPERATPLLVSTTPQGAPVGFRLNVSLNSLTMALVNGSAANSLAVKAEVLPQPGQWYHFAICYDGSRSAQGFQFWLDGSKIQLTTLNDDLYGIARAPEGTLTFRYPTRPETAPTLIDELQIHLSALTEIEIAHLRDGKALLAAVREEFPREDLLFNYYLRSRSPQARATINQALAISNQISILQSTALLVPVAGETPLPTNRPLLPFHPLSLDSSPDRLGFANWLTSDRNPLTPRVLASRLYQMIHGISLLPDNNISDPWITPTDPELLDFLARDILVKEWNLRDILRTILLHPPHQTSQPPLLEPLDPTS